MGGAESVSSHYVVQQKVAHQLDQCGFDKFSNINPDHGNFGVVRRGIDTRTNSARAIKRIAKTRPDIAEHVHKEIEIMKSVAGLHPNVVHFFEHFEDGNGFDLVFEFCEHGTLMDAIKNADLSTGSAASLCHQLLSAVSFLHSRGILHHDVKPANVLISDGSTCKLGDFGSACVLQGDELLKRKSGTPAFFSPEIEILPHGHGYSFPSDVWAIGVTLYMMLFKGAHPFMDGNRMETRLLRAADFATGLSWMWNASQVQFLTWLLMPCPAQRIPANKACDHAWLGSLGIGKGSFSENPPAKLVPDCYGRFTESSSFF